jgi:hypothetical protein
MAAPAKHGLIGRVHGYRRANRQQNANEGWGEYTAPSHFCGWFLFKNHQSLLLKKTYVFFHACGKGGINYELSEYPVGLCDFP